MKDYDKICDFKNLYEAHTKCRNGKRNKSEVIRFELDLARNLDILANSLKERTYRMSGYYHFTIYEPKQREIYATSYVDRLVLRCLCDEVLIPILQPRLIYDNVACQKGKGTHFGMDRFSKHLRDYFKKNGNCGYVLKCDITKYFDNIDHQILKKKLRKVIHDQDVYALLSHIIDSFGVEKGLPLGNQTSQWFALFYLDSMDRYIKEYIKVKGYVRYMDDLVLLFKTKAEAQICKGLIAIHVNELKLTLNHKTQVFPLKNGVEFLGFRYSLSTTGKIVKRIKKQTKQRFKRRVKQLQYEYRKGVTSLATIEQVLASYRGHLLVGDTYHFRCDVYRNMKFVYNYNYHDEDG